MKQCRRCGEVKPLEAFGKNKSKKDGLHYYCRECAAAYAKAYCEQNPARARAQRKAYYEANKERCQAGRKAWGEANYETNLPRRRADQRARKAGLATATPMWADRDAIAAIYAEADRLTSETGIPHHVDHIIPLKGRGVCGLHVPWNLRAIPAAENLSKSNRLILD